MTATLIGEEYDKQSYSANSDAERGTRVFVVATDDVDDRGDDVCAATGVPVIGETWPDSSPGDLFVCTDVTAVPIHKQNKFDGTSVSEGGGEWRVTCSYSSSYDEWTMAQDPTDRPAQWSGDWAVGTKPTDFKFESADATAEVVPLVKLTGEPFQPGIERIQVIPRKTVTKNLDEGDLPDPLAYKEKTNDATFLGAAAGTVMVSNMRITGPYTEHGIEFWTVTVEFSYNPDGHDPTLLETSTNELLSGELVPIMGKDGKKIVDPIPVKSSGADVVAIDPADVADDAVFNQHILYRRTDFSELAYT